VSFTDILRIPKVGVGVPAASYPQYYWNWANQDESRRFQAGLFVNRPTASSVTLSKVYIVTDCTTTACTAGTGTPGTTCLTYINDSQVWTTVGCFGNSAADVQSLAGTYVDNQIARFNGTTGNVIDNATCTISDLGVIGGTCSLANDLVTPNAIKSAGQVDGYCLTYEATGTTFAWQPCGTGGGVSNPLIVTSATPATVNAEIRFAGDNVWSVGNDTNNNDEFTVSQSTGLNFALASIRINSATNGLFDVQLAPGTGQFRVITNGGAATRFSVNNSGDTVIRDNDGATRFRCNGDGSVSSTCSIHDEGGIARFLVGDNVVIRDSTGTTDAIAVGGSGGVTFSSGSTPTVQGGGEFRWRDTDNSNFVGLKAPATASLTANRTYQLPSDVPINGDVLVWHTGDVLQWDTISTTSITATPGVDCSGLTDSTAGVQAALNALGSTGATIYIPGGCKLGLKSPGAGAASILIPNNVHIVCADQSAGFFAQQQYCSTGTFGASASAFAPFGGATCNTNADCPGSGTCVSSFGAGAGAACTATTCFAPTAGQTYTMLKDSGGASSDIFIENCSIWAAQADPFQRCVGGSNPGKPCRQECSTGSTLPGARCDVNGDCISGTCDLSKMNCTTGGGSCTGAPLSPSGPGNIIPLDLTSTTNAKLTNVSIYDHFVTPNSSSGFSLSVGNQSTLVNVNAARELTDCTSPFATPTDSRCLSAGLNGGTCCYGAANNAFAAANKNNTQPTTNVFYGMKVGSDSQLIRTYARGKSFSFNAAAQTRIDESTVWPPSLNGPGTAACGFVISTYGQVAKSQALNLGTGCTGISLTGDDAGVIANKLGSNSLQSYAKGIDSTAVNSHIVSNTIKELGGNGIGIESTGTDVLIADNTIKDNGVIGNQIGISNHDTANALISNNRIGFSQGTQLPAAHGIGIKLGSAGSQNRVGLNHIQGGWRGITAENAPSGSLNNTQYVANRIVSQAGACFNLGGAGVFVDGNYCNSSNSVRPTTTCDPSCAVPNRGNQCNSDADCGTCSVTFKCVPEPAFAWIGHAGCTGGGCGTTHNTYAKNVVFMPSQQPVKQCGTTPAGQLCETATSTCNGGATCSTGTLGGCPGGAITCCQTGSEAGKYCCTAGSCLARTPTAFFRLSDYGATSPHTNLNIALNTVFPGGTVDSIIGVDMVGPQSLGNMVITGSQIVSNIFDGSNSTNSTAIKFPTAGTANVVNVDVADNGFYRWPTPASVGSIANYQGSFGSISLRNGSIARTDFPILLTTAQTLFSSLWGNDNNATENNFRSVIVGAGTIWKMTCTASDTPGGTSTRTFTVRKGTGGSAGGSSDTTMLCQMTAGVQQCTPAAGSASAPIAFALGDRFTMKQVSVVGTSLAATAASCALYVSFDTVM
jgi:hypothetical protein